MNTTFDCRHADTNATICRRLAALVEAAAPELGGLYVLDDRTLPVEYRCLWGATSYVSVGLADRLRPYIPDWHGTAPAMVIGIETQKNFAEMAARRGNEPPDDLLRRPLYGLAVHESAHLVADGDYRDCTPPTAPVESPAVTFRRRNATDAPPVERVERALTHDARFVRCAAHLTARAEAMGVEVDLIDVIGTTAPGLATKYTELLGTEPERMDGWSFARILATKAPAGFIAYFESELRLWWRDQSSLSPPF